uniref:Integrase catalytic domain-containing protein n=1 Tax=Oryza brachyantha TaxID=4533 RepID=J3MSM6_ORYBR
MKYSRPAPQRQRFALVNLHALVLFQFQALHCETNYTSLCAFKTTSSRVTPENLPTLVNWRRAAPKACQNGSKLHLSSAFHPQTDGQTERVNQCLEIYLRCFIHATPTKWASWLYLAEFWYNTSYHSSLGKTPFEVLYGHSPNFFGITSQDSVVQDLQAWLSDRKLIQQLLKQHLNRAQQQMKHYADKKRSFREFHIGDWVYLKLQPYVQSSVAYRANHKLSFRYFGPFQITAKIGAVAYRLQLPDDSKIHPVFHVSQLRFTHGFSGTVLASLPASNSSLQIPLEFLDHRVAKQGNTTQSQLLTRWSDGHAEEATWENLEDLKTRFPAAPAWGQAGFQEWGIVRTPSDRRASAEREEQHCVPDDLQTTEPASASMGRARRQRRPNSRITGPEWVCASHIELGFMDFSAAAPAAETSGETKTRSTVEEEATGRAAKTVAATAVGGDGGGKAPPVKVPMPQGILQVILACEREPSEEIDAIIGYNVDDDFEKFQAEVRREFDKTGCYMVEESYLANIAAVQAELKEIWADSKIDWSTMITANWDDFN